MPQGSELIKSLIFTIVVPCSVTVLLPHFILSSSAEVSAAHSEPLRYAGAVLIVLGCASYFHCVWHFVVYGKGTPAPIAPPKEIVVRGLYRYVRNPMYVGVLSVLVGEGLFFESLTLLVYAAAVLIGFHLFVLFYEEPVLRRRFGDSYERYRESVPRWIPRLKRGGVRESS